MRSVHIRFRALLALLLFPALGAVATPAHGEEYDPVITRDLREQPQRFWARGVVFFDVLERSPENRPRKLGDERLYEFRTETLGECFATEEALDSLAGIEPGDAAVFAGSVIQVKRKFYFRIADAVAVATMPTNLVQAIARVDVTAEDIHARTLAKLERLNESIHTLLVGYARTEGVNYEDLLAGDTRNPEALRASVRAALREFESREGVPGTEFLVDLLSAIVALQRNLLPMEPELYQPEDIPPATLPLDLPDEETVAPEDAVTLPYNLPAEPAAADAPAEAGDAAMEPEVVEPYPAPVLETERMSGDAPDAAPVGDVAPEQDPDVIAANPMAGELEVVEFEEAPDLAEPEMDIPESTADEAVNETDVVDPGNGMLPPAVTDPVVEESMWEEPGTTLDAMDAEVDADLSGVLEMDSGPEETLAGDAAIVPAGTDLEAAIDEIAEVANDAPGITPVEEPVIEESAFIDPVEPADPVEIAVEAAVETPEAEPAPEATAEEPGGDLLAEWLEETAPAEEAPPLEEPAAESLFVPQFKLPPVALPPDPVETP